MRIQLLSDLHLESDPDFQAAPPPARTCWCSGRHRLVPDRSRLMETDFGLGAFPARWSAPVVYVPGNHEYDNLDFDETHDRLREPHSLDIHWLECETRVMQGVWLVGTTLWTDFDALAQPDEELGSVLKKRAKAFRAADFYWLAGMRRHGEPSWRNRCANRVACQQWLDEALRQPFDGVTVVITHFAPTLASADPRYGVTPGTAGFCTLDACCRAPTTGCTATCIARWTM